MAVKAGKFTLPGSGDFTVNGVGFDPAVIVLMSAGLTAENSWNTGSPVRGVVGVFSRTTDPPGFARSASGETWAPGYTTYLPQSYWAQEANAGVMWFQDVHGAFPNGFAFFPTGTTPDGFTMSYSGGFEGGTGVVVYYLAIQSDKGVGSVLGYKDNPSPTVTLGWEPSLIFSTAGGGFTGAPPPGGIALANFSVPSWAFGGFDNVANGTEPGPRWMSNGLADITSVEQTRFFSDGWHDHFVYDAETVAQTLDNSFFVYDKTATDATVSYFDGFPSAFNIRGQAVFMEEGLYSGGAVNPNSVGAPLEIDTGFIPEAVIFMAPQDHHDLATLGLVPWGGRCFGFLTDTFQCCIAWGGYSHIGPIASFCTSDFSWISNFTSTQLDDPTNPNYGTAEIGGAGFIMHTQAMPKFNQYVHYVALGFEEEAPGFFRII